MIIITVLAILSVVFSAVWVYRDAKKRGLPAGLWAFLVVASSNFLGLILYILIGRKQERIICGHCKMPTGQSEFCSKCGKELKSADSDSFANQENVKTSWGLLIASIACIALTFIMTGVLIVSIFFPSDGFIMNNTQSSYQYNLLDDASARSVRQNSSGDTWEISFREASEGYTFTNYYRAKTQPSRLELDINYSGSVRLTVSQVDVSITEIVTEGLHEFDMSVFSTGRIKIEIMNLSDGRDYSGILTIISQ
jgi:hypothetical protein